MHSTLHWLTCSFAHNCFMSNTACSSSLREPSTFLRIVAMKRLRTPFRIDRLFSSTVLMLA